jgi:beta-lactamase regulating signal transducer with metallopeptidase domain
MHEPIVELVPMRGRALLHFLWQGALIGLLAALALQLLANARPQARYAVACLALLACVLAPLATLLLEVAGVAGVVAAAPMAPLPAASFPESAGAFAAPMPASTSGLVPAIDHALPWIVAAWAAGACTLSLRLAAGVWWLGRLPRVSAPCLQRKWQQKLDALALVCGLRRPVELRLVDALDTPAAAGWWRPVVLLPASLLARLPVDYVEALLAHELAHVRRHDYLVNLLQGLAEALLFYHPVTWWLSRRIHSERELVADRLAAEATGEPRRLAQALAALADHHAALRAVPRPALAALEPEGGQLMSRIEHLVRPGRTRSGGRFVFPLLGLAAAGLAFYAQAQREPQAAASAPVGVAGAAAAPVAKPVASAAAQAAPATAPATSASPVKEAAPRPPAPPTPPTHMRDATSLPAPLAQPAPPHAVPAPPAAPAPPAPPAPPKGVSLTRTGQGDAYAVVRKGSEAYLVSGSSDDHAQIQAARGAIDSDFVWFRRDGKPWVVTDPALVARARQQWSETEAIGERMRGLGQEMEAHGAKMQAIGQRMEKLAGAAPPPKDIEAAADAMQALAREQGQLARRQARLGLEQAEAAEAGDARREAALQGQMQTLDREQEALAARMEAQSRRIEAASERHQQALQPMEALSREMEAAGAPMDALGRQMDGLGKQMDEATRRAEQGMRKLIAEAVAQGLARPLPQRQ